MKSRLKLMSIGVLIISTNTSAMVCPNASKAPLCPISGTTLLDETYPTQAFVISNSPRDKNIQSSKVTAKYINTIAKSYDYENMPQVLVPASSDEDFAEVVSRVEAELKINNVKPEQIKKVLAQMGHIKSPAYTWQQDYFESFVDLKTGHPILREFSSYKNIGDPKRTNHLEALDKMQEAGKECQIKKGTDIKSNHGDDDKADYDLINYTEKLSFGNGEMGGNVEGAPGGFCLIGDNQSITTANSYCGNKENIIQLQISWMNVGHVDEIFKIIPSKINDGRPLECQFSVMAASPKKAFELMSNPANKNNSFYTFSPRMSDEELQEAIKAKSRLTFIDQDDKTEINLENNNIICGYVENAVSDGSLVPENKINKEGASGKTVFMKLIVDDVSAGINVVGNDNCRKYIDKITNDQIKENMQKNENLIKLNNAIQESIDKDKELIRSKIISRLPQCKKFFDFLDVPDLFYGPEIITKDDGKIELPKPGTAKSFLPNPTNSVLMNKTILLPESGNAIFDSYAKEELRKRKLNVETIDSWDYAHIGDGNIHCSSHSIQYCKPR